MCYSAQIQSDYRKFVRLHGATLDLKAFAKLWVDQLPPRARVRMPKAAEDWLRDLDSPEAQALWQRVLAMRAARESDLQQELFKQAKRLADAERTLKSKTTKKALEDQRIAGDKIAKLKTDLDDLQRTEPKARDGRFFPGHYVPVIVEDGGAHVVRPMRYHCRLPGWTAAVERKYPGTYNARRDSLGRAWADLFGQRHGIIVVTAFYENVERHAAEHRALADGEAPENIVLEFRPRPEQDMVLACLWNESQDADGTLLSFAAITDDPAPEVAAAGHDRTVIQIKPENVDRWLTPQGRSRDELQAILDDRPEAYYEHRVARAA